MNNKTTFKKEKVPAFRKKFAGKADFVGKSFLVLGASDNAYLLELRSRSQGLRTFQVVDNDKSGIYPQNRSQLSILNPFVHPNYKNALTEYKKRNQLTLDI